MRKSEVGNIIAIPSDVRFGVAKVIYVSEYFTNVILLKLHRTAFLEGECVSFPDADASADLYYTSSTPIKTGRWKLIGFQSASVAEKLLSKRTVAGDVWNGDECIGTASELELETLPKMLTYGYKLIEKAVARLPVSDRR